jgi:4-hydroxyphenylpyruvate dioxygenase
MAYKCGISSISLGRAFSHELFQKLDAAAANNIQGIEVSWEDLEFLAAKFSGHRVENQVEAAKLIRKRCDERGLEIICLQPFADYEGLYSRQHHTEKIEQLKIWLKLAKILRTDLITITSNSLPPQEATTDVKLIIRDLLEVAELGLQENPIVRFAYKAVCWGMLINTWEQSWVIAKCINRPNFGICLDAFNIAGRQWVDLQSADGRLSDADTNLQRSLARLKYIDVNKLFLVQIADAEHLQSLLSHSHPQHVTSPSMLRSWAQNAGLFPFEMAGYLPILSIIKAITYPRGLNYSRGWISMELFSRTTVNPHPRCPETHARRGMIAWQNLLKAMNL